jgi:hypothetical protein
MAYKHTPFSITSRSHGSAVDTCNTVIQVPECQVQAIRIVSQLRYRLTVTSLLCPNICLTQWHLPASKSRANTIIEESRVSYTKFYRKTKVSWRTRSRSCCCRFITRQGHKITVPCSIVDFYNFVEPNRFDSLPFYFTVLKYGLAYLIVTVSLMSVGRNKTKKQIVDSMNMHTAVNTLLQIKRNFWLLKCA